MTGRPGRTAVTGVLLALAVPAVPAAAYLTAGHPAAQAGCALTRSGTIPARGPLSDPAGLEAGTFWWQASPHSGSVCTGMVQMWLEYPGAGTAEWQAGIYRGPALVTVIADRVYAMGAGWHAEQFTIPAGASAAGSICLTARFGPGAGAVRTCADPQTAGGSS